MRVTDELMETPGEQKYFLYGSRTVELVSLPRGALYESRGMSHQAFLFRHVEPCTVSTFCKKNTERCFQCSSTYRYRPICVDRCELA